MTVQALALIMLVFAGSFTQFVLLAILLGWGTAMVYPTFLASIAENTHPHDRPKSLGVFRLWRDLGYAIGAVITGIIADAIGMNASIIFIAALTFTSGLIILYRMKCSGDHFGKLASWIFNKALGRKFSTRFRNSAGFMEKTKSSDQCRNMFLTSDYPLNNSI
jgi:MFS family permease